MCGIVGVRRFDGRPVPEDLVRQMAEKVRHRGPDGEGYWTDAAVAFGHKRLSIIDVAGSPQPMHSADGACTITFNGEILNYQEVRQNLNRPLKTHGDTEVLLELFRDRGIDALTSIRGQFAFGIYDRRDGDLWLVRDRMGILPLYYFANRELVAFASEAKALEAAIPSGFEVDRQSLSAYLAHRSIPAPNTLFKGVKKLPPAHWLRVDKSGKIEIGAYWSLPAPSEERQISPKQAVDALDDALTDAVREALVADVPVGAYLSGGVDSSLIVALAAKERGGQPLETFSAGFGDERYDELPFARTVSNLLGTRHHEVHVRPDDFIGDWHKLTWHRDAPISEPSDMAVYRLAALAKTRVKVVLSGEGSDELFGGYPKYRYAAMSRYAGLIPNALRGPSLRFLGSRLRPGGEKLRILLRALEGSSEWERARGWFAPFSETERRQLLGDGYANGHAAQHLEGDSVRRLLGVDCGAWLADNLLERGDRMSMAASLELRPPFLDQRLVELAFRMPSSVKVREKVPKWIVKEVARRHLPQEISARRKVGFKVPLDSWFKGGLSEMAGDLLCSPNSFVGGIFNTRPIQALLASHQTGKHNEEIRLWTLLSLEVWHRTFFGERTSI